MGSAETYPKGAGREADEPRILDSRLPVLDRFAVDWVADHGDKGGDARILSDEAEIPALLDWPDQRLLEPAAPDDRSAGPGRSSARKAAKASLVGST
jgi:hypothetical protein